MQVPQSVREVNPATIRMTPWRRSLKGGVRHLISTLLPLITCRAQTVLILPCPACIALPKDADLTKRQRMSKNGFAIRMVMISRKSIGDENNIGFDLLSLPPPRTLSRT